VASAGQLNLFLHVTGRRQDGYHDLQTIFQLIDRCDRIGLTLRPDGAITRSAGMPDVEPDKDLAVRAARACSATAARRWARISRSLNIFRRAAAWVAAVRMQPRCCWPSCPVAVRSEPGTTARVGLALGADVPVFVFGSQPGARAAGNG